MFYSTCITEVFMSFLRILPVSLNAMRSILKFLRSFMPFCNWCFLWRFRCISRCHSMWCCQFCLFWGSFCGSFMSFMSFGNWCFSPKISWCTTFTSINQHIMHKIYHPPTCSTCWKMDQFIETQITMHITPLIPFLNNYIPTYIRWRWNADIASELCKSQVGVSMLNLRDTKQRERS